MNTNIRIARLLGIPVIVNISWLLTLAFVTSILALRFYPEVLPPGSPYRDDRVLHWVMAISSGLIFFSSILLHEFAHSVVALRFGIPVKSITLFIFGGVSQIGGEARRPLHEFLMALAGPLTSLLLGGVFFALWYLSGHSEDKPLQIMLEWLFLMNLIIAIFNMAPGFPMDGGRVLRSLIWGVSGNLYRATFLATLLGRGLGYALMAVGALAFFGILGFMDSWSGAWFAILGLFLESSASQSWFQARALDILTRYSAEDIMARDLETAYGSQLLRYITSGAGPRFIFFVADQEENVIGVVTEKEVDALPPERRDVSTASDAMVPRQDVAVAGPLEDGASLLQRMEADAIWHLPIVSEGRVIGVVSKDALLRILARNFLPRRTAPMSGG